MVKRSSFVVATAAWFAVIGVSLFAAIGPTPVAREAAAPTYPLPSDPALVILGPLQATAPRDNQDGQNVIFGDGERPPFPNPFMGTQHDNIFTGRLPATSGPFTTTSHAGQAMDGDTDSILLPAMN